MPILLSHNSTTESFLRQFDLLSPEEQVFIYKELGQKISPPIALQTKKQGNNESRDSKRTFEELCRPWREDGRTAEEIIQDIYESRTVGRERECDYHVHFS